MSRDGHAIARLRPFENAPRPVVGYAQDYVDGWRTGLHAHPRAQLLHAAAGVMRMETERAAFTVPPGTGLFVPAGVLHVVRMDGRVAMRAVPAGGCRAPGRTPSPSSPSAHCCTS